MCHCFFRILCGVSYSYSQWNQFHIHIKILHLNLDKVQWILHVLHLNLCRVCIAERRLYFTMCHISMCYSHILVCDIFPIIQLDSNISVRVCYVYFHVLHLNLLRQLKTDNYISACAVCISVCYISICSDNCRLPVIFERVLRAFQCVIFEL